MHHDITKVLEDTKYYDIPKLVTKVFSRALVLLELTQGLSGDSFRWYNENIVMYYLLNHNTSTKSCTITSDKYSSFLSSREPQDLNYIAMGETHTVWISDSKTNGLIGNPALDAMLNDRDIRTVEDLGEDLMMSYLLQGIPKYELYQHLLHNESVLFNRQIRIRATLNAHMSSILNDDVYRLIIETFLKNVDATSRETFMESVLQYSSFYPEIVTEIAGTKWQNSSI